MDNRNVLIGALVIGGIIVFMLARRGAGASQLSSLAPLPSGQGDQERAGAFRDLVQSATSLELAGLGRARDERLAQLQAQVELARIGAAERTSAELASTQVLSAQTYANAQGRRDWLTFAGTVLGEIPDYIRIFQGGGGGGSGQWGTPAYPGPTYLGGPPRAYGNYPGVTWYGYAGN